MFSPAAHLVAPLEKLHDEYFAPNGLSQEAGDFCAALIVAFMCLVAKSFVARLPLSTIFKIDSKEKRLKIDEFIFKCSFRLFTTILGLTLVLSKPYFWDPDRFLYMNGNGEMDCFHNVDGVQKIGWEPAGDERVYYVIIYGYYFEHFVTQFSDPSSNRSDFWPMFIHHCVTLGLIMGSYTSGESRVGVMVAAMHEPSDLLLGMAKMCKYLNDGPWGHFGADLFFVLFLLSWIVFRLILYPIKCIYANTPMEVVWGWADSWGIPVSRFSSGWVQSGCVLENYTTSLAENMACRAEIGFMWNGFGLKRGVMLAGMYILLILHIYWSVLIFNVIAQKFKTGRVADVRSGAEDGSKRLAGNKPLQGRSPSDSGKNKLS